MIVFCMCCCIIAALISSFSQILLKKSTMINHSGAWKEYLNLHVLSAYVFFSLALFLNLYAFSILEYRLGAVINATSYLFTMLLSVLFLHDTLNWRCICGNLLIFIGIVIYVVF